MGLALLGGSHLCERLLGDGYEVISVDNYLTASRRNLAAILDDPGFDLTDMETCYKMFRRDVIQAITIEEDRFGFDPEITAKVARDCDPSAFTKVGICAPRSGT